MGKEWVFWGTGGGKSTKKAGRSGGRGADDEAPVPPSGCMCAVLQLFDLNQFQFALHHQPSFNSASFLQEEPSTTTTTTTTTSSKGLEAPRNSLELEEPCMESASSSSSSTCRKGKAQGNLSIPVSIQIKTTRENKSPRASISKAAATKDDDFFSEAWNSNSPAGTKTPTLVARLMGLDQLPPQPQTTCTATASPSTTTLTSLSNLRMHPQNQRREPQRYYSGVVSRIQFLNQSRSCSNTSFYDNDISAGSGTLSLPETPRISSARRSDVDHGHRLSLQIINKENIGEEFEFSGYTAAAAKKLAPKGRQHIKKADDHQENRRAGGHYAREIVKQMKESVSRKVGLDITNTFKSREQRIISTDDHVVLLKPKKPSRVVIKNGNESSPSKQSTPSCSPRLLDPMNKPVAKNQTSSNSPRLLSPLSPYPESQLSQQGKVHTKPKPPVPKLQEEQQNSVVPKKVKKDGTRKYSSRIRETSQASDPILKKKEEPFVRPTTTHKGNVTDKKCKKTPISNDLFNISVPTLLPVKKQSQASSSSDGEVWSRSTQICSSSQSYKQQQQQVTRTLNFQENIQDRCNRTSTLTSTSTCTPSGDQVVELEYRYYIQRILKRAGVDKATPVSLAKWYSPSHPLDPSIFHYIELFHPTVTNIVPGAKDSELNFKCNRRLVFQLVDELLADILKPYLGLKQCWWARDQMCGSKLIDTLCSRIKKFPAADCKVLEDIDALIVTDLGKSSWLVAHEEEGDGMVEEIQRDILKSLLHETAMGLRIQSAWVIG